MKEELDKEKETVLDALKQHSTEQHRTVQNRTEQHSTAHAGGTREISQVIVLNGFFIFHYYFFMKNGRNEKLLPTSPSSTSRLLLRPPYTWKTEAIGGKGSEDTKASGVFPVVALNASKRRSSLWKGSTTVTASAAADGGGDGGCDGSTSTFLLPRRSQWTMPEGRTVDALILKEVKREGDEEGRKGFRDVSDRRRNPMANCNDSNKPCSMTKLVHHRVTVMVMVMVMVMVVVVVVCLPMETQHASECLPWRDIDLSQQQMCHLPIFLREQFRKKL
ncbi:hypothetical protein M0802_001499 [Mischocyttarus mexicanus]|nr:hypothetical protein M0802_001499 [Mischocyttarus mexicanus]